MSTAQHATFYFSNGSHMGKDAQVFTIKETVGNNKPTAEEREIVAGYARKYSRGNSGPRLIDIANDSTRGKAGVTAVLKAFAKVKS